LFIFRITLADFIRIDMLYVPTIQICKDLFLVAMPSPDREGIARFVGGLHVYCCTISAPYYTRIMKILLIWTFSGLMLAAGLNHLVNPYFYKTFIPKPLPLLAVNYIFGIIEFGLGAGLLIPGYRRYAALGLLILMIFFLPFHLIDVFRKDPAIGSKLLAYIRLPLQFVLIWWAWYISK